MRRINIAYYLSLSLLICSCVHQRFLTFPKLFKYHTMNSDIIVSSAPSGVNASSIGGNILIDEAKEKADVMTIRGDIVIKSFSGKINAEAASGKVEINFDCETNECKSSGNITAINGDIMLTIPKNNSMNIYVEMASTGDDNKHRFSSSLGFVDSLSKNNVWNFYGFYKKIETKYYKSSGPNTLHIFAANGSVFIDQLDNMN